MAEYPSRASLRAARKTAATSTTDAPIETSSVASEINLDQEVAPVARQRRRAQPRPVARRFPRAGLLAGSAIAVSALMVSLNFWVPNSAGSDTAVTVAKQSEQITNLAAMNNLAADIKPRTEPSPATAQSPLPSPTAHTAKKRKAQASQTSPTSEPTSAQAAPDAQATAPLAAAPTVTPSVAAEQLQKNATQTSTKTSTSDASATQTASKTATTTQTSSRPAVTLDGRTAGGWYGGAGGFGVADGSFQNWLGSSVTIKGTWADSGDEEQRTVSGLSGYEGWNGAMDIAVGGLVGGEDYASAANGAYDDRWRAAAAKIAAVRKGASGPTFVRPFHEMNGDVSWSAWPVTPSNASAFRQAFARYADIMRSAMPEAYMVWSPNYGAGGTAPPLADYYPGDAYVDVVGPDYYSDYDVENGAANDFGSWTAHSTDSLRGSPVGIEAWRRFAESHGKPFAMPEWGVKPGGGRATDIPEWISSVNKWAQSHQNTATWQLGQAPPAASAGKVLYMCYFNVNHGDPNYMIYGAGTNPNAAERYRSLRWGNN